MTAQATEILHYENQVLSMCSLPLNEYFSLIQTEPKFRVECTALWRGYIGTWEISESRLYLVGLDGFFEDGEKASLNSIFEGFPDRVFAHWYSGKIRATSGALLDYVHGGFASKYEQDLFFNIKKGVFESLEIRNNEIDLDGEEDIF